MARTNRFKPVDKKTNKKKSNYSKQKNREKIQLREYCKTY